MAGTGYGMAVGVGVGVGAGVGVGGGGGTVPISIVTVTLLTESFSPAGMTRLTVCVKSPVMPLSGIGTVLMVRNELSRSCGPVATTVNGLYVMPTR